MDQELVGIPLHRFATMRQLRISVTEAWNARRLLTAEERIAMLLNPGPFRLVQENPLADDGLTRNGIFFLGSFVELNNMGQAMAVPVVEDMWTGYSHAGVREDKKVGISKADKKVRRHLPERTELSLVRYEVKGRLRMRRRTTMPCDEDFFARAGYHVPHPDLMVFEYRMYPNAPRDTRAEHLIAMDVLTVAMREVMGEVLVPFPIGPEHPPGIYQPLEFQEAVAAEAAEQAAAMEGLGAGGGRGRGRGRGQGRGQGRGRGRGQPEAQAGLGRGRGQGRGHGRGPGNAEAGLGRGRGRGPGEAEAEAGLGRGRGHGRGGGVV